MMCDYVPLVCGLRQVRGYCLEVWVLRLLTPQGVEQGLAVVSQTLPQ